MAGDAPIVSHGRGGIFAPYPPSSHYSANNNLVPYPGQGNIGPDSTEYVDGEIVREGVYGDQGDGAYSAGVRS